MHHARVKFKYGPLSGLDGGRKEEIFGEDGALSLSQRDSCFDSMRRDRRG